MAAHTDATDKPTTGQFYRKATGSTDLSHRHQLPSPSSRQRKWQTNDYVVAVAMALALILALAGAVYLADAFTRLFP